MYKLLIVDDEPGVRKGLASLLDWKALGFEVAGDAGDGTAALSLVDALAPDLVLLDIRMPGMSGIEVLKELDARAKKPKALMLTGYSDFEYARSAINNGAKGYILKPVDEDELEARVRDIREELDAERNLARLADTALTGERSARLARLLTGKLAPGTAETAFPADPPDTVYQVALFSLELSGYRDNSAEFEALADDFFSLLKKETARLDRYLAVVFRNENADTVRRYLEQFHRRLTWLGHRESGDETAESDGAIAALGKRRAGIDGLLDSWREADRAASNLFFTEGIPFVDAEQAEAGDSRDRGAAQGGALKAGPAPGDTGANFPDARSIIPFIEIYDTARIEKEFAALERALRHSALAPDEARNHCIALAMEIRATLMAKHPEKEICANPVNDLVTVILESRYLPEAVGAVRRYALGIASEFTENVPGNHILKVIQYVRNNYAKDLKLESLGDTFACNSAYLGKRFREQTGESFNAYLDRIRIDAAKELLGTTDLKVYQVSKLVGYSNIDYFFTKFRKHVHMTPRAFKTGRADSGEGEDTGDQTRDLTANPTGDNADNADNPPSDSGLGAPD